MNAKLIGVVVVGLVIVAGAIGALVTGIGTSGYAASDSDGDSEETYEHTVVVGGTDSGESASGSSEGSDGSGSTEELPPFSFGVEKIEKCGDTCRKVTASITNNQNESKDVTVRSVIYTDGEKIWEGKSRLGSLESGETRTDTKTVKLSYMEAYKVKQNDGKILVKTYVVTEDATYVFKERRDVA